MVTLKGPNCQAPTEEFTQEWPAVQLQDPPTPVMGLAVAEEKNQMTLLILRGAHADYSHDHHRHHPLHLPILYCPEETKRQRMSPVSQVWEKEELGRLDLFPHYITQTG